LNTNNPDAYPAIPVRSGKYHSFQTHSIYNTPSRVSRSNDSNRLNVINFTNNIAYWNNNSDMNRFGFRSNKSYNHNVNNAGVYIALVVIGYFKPTKTGVWSFYVEADDAAVVWIDDKKNARGTTVHWPPTDTNYNFTDGNSTNPYTTTLTQGVYYPIQITYWQGWGSSKFIFMLKSPGGSFTSNSTGMFFSLK
jgi:hypothetical protein